MFEQDKWKQVEWMDGEILFITDPKYLTDAGVKRKHNHKIGVGRSIIEASDQVMERFRRAAIQGGYDTIFLYNGIPVRNGENVYLYQSAIFYKTD